ncbi:MAG: 3'-5' exonuclease [Cryomorphaceae bacterium]|nr:3'-5' exonuclease [Cryomorphaceae bacterium]
MLENINLQDILFLDIETAPVTKNFEDLSEEMQWLWDRKSARTRTEDQSPADAFFERAGIFAEYGKIICISVGFLHKSDGDWHFRMRSFADHDEKKLLGDFAHMLTTHFSSEYKRLCGHNGKEFDFPYICRRMLINEIRIPPILQIQGKKPWEVQHLDTLDLWKFGDYKNYTSLRLLAALFNIPTPKDDIDGSEVAGVYWNDNDLDRIVTYCEKDVVTTARIFLKMMGNHDPIRDENIVKNE